MKNFSSISRNVSSVHLLSYGIVLLALPGISGTARAMDSQSEVQTSSLGAPSSSGHSSDIDNLNYYPHARQFLFTPLFSTAIYDQTYSGNPNEGTGSSNISSSEAQLTATYGVTDRFRISLSETELFATDSTHQSSTSGTTTFSRTSGLSDPTMSATLRYLDDDVRSHLSGDIGLSLSPSWVTHDIADTQQNGSEGKGYGTFAASAPIYWWLGHNEVEFSPSITHDFSGNSVGPTTATSSVRAANWNGSLTLLDRFHITDQLYIQGGAALDLPYSVQTTSLNAAGTVSTTQYPLHLVPRIDLGYRCAANVLFDAEYEYYNYDSQVVETSSNTQTVESTLAMKFLIQI